MWEPLLLMLISNVYAYPAFVSVQIYCEIGLWDPPLKDSSWQISRYSMRQKDL